MKSWVRVNQDLAVQLNSLLSPVRLPKNRTKGFTPFFVRTNFGVIKYIFLRAVRLSWEN